MATAGSIVVDLLARTGSFETDMDRAAKKVDQTAKSIDRAVVAIGAAGVAFVGASAAMAMAAAKAMDATSKMAQQIGVTTEALTGMRFAAQQFVNISDQQFDMSMRRMTRRIEEAAQGGGAAKNALDAMGLSARELARLTPDKQMLALADAMKSTESQAKRLQYAMAIFDTEGMALVPALQQGAAAFEENIRLAQRYGVVLSQEAAQAAEQFLTNLGLLKTAQEGYRQQIAEALLPSLVMLTDRLVELSQSVGPIGDKVATALKLAGAAATATAVIFTTRLVGAAYRSVAGWVAATGAAAAHQMQLAQLSAAVNGTSASMARMAGIASGSLAAVSRAGSLALGVLGGGAGLLVTAGLTAAAFLAMGRDAKAAATDVDELTRSFETLNQRQLESAAFNLENELVELSKQAEGHGQILRGLINDYDGLTARYGENYEGLRNVRQAIREEEEALAGAIAAIEKKSPLLAQLVRRMWELDTATRGATGSTNDLNRAMGFSEAGEKYLAQIQGRIKALQDSGDPIKIASRYIAEHTDLTEADRVAIMSAAHAEKVLIAARDAAARSTKAGTSAINEAKKAAEAFRKEQERSIAAQFQSVSAIHEQAQGLEDQVLLFGLSKTALEDLTIARLEEQAAMLRGFDGSQEQVEAIEREIEARQRLRTAMGSLEQKEAERAAWESWAQDVEQIFNRVGQSLTDAIFDGGKSGRDLLRDLFKGLTFNVLINPVMNQLQGWVTNQLGGMFGVQNPQQQASGGGFGFSGGTFGAGGVEMAGDWLLRSGLAPETGAKMLMNADKIAKVGGSILSYGSAIYDLSQGKYGSAAGTAIGQLLGGPPGAMVGNFLGGFVDSIFGGFSGETRSGGQWGYAFDGQAWDNRAGRWVEGDQATFLQGPSGARGGTDAAVEAAINQTVATINSLYSAVGSDLELTRYHAGWESSTKGRGGVMAGGILSSGAAFGEDGSGSVYRGKRIFEEHSPRTLTPEEAIQYFEQDLWQSIIQSVQAGADEFPDIIRGMVEGIDAESLSKEAAQGLVTSMQVVIDQVTGFQIAVEQLPFANLRDLSFDAAANLIQLAGGLEQLDAGMTSYFQNFYSEAEQIEWMTDQMSASLAELGFTMPDLSLGADAAKASLRDFVEGLDVTDEAGARAFAGVMNLAGSYAELAAASEEMANKVIEDARRAAEETQRIEDRIASERYSLETQLLQLQGDTITLRMRELETIDAANRGLQQQIWTLQDAAAAQQAYQSSIQSITGSLSGLRETITLDQLGTDEARYGYFKSQSDALAAMIPDLEDADAITRAINQIQSYTSRAYGTLDSEQKIEMGDEFLSYLNRTEDLALKQIEIANQQQADRTGEAVAKAVGEHMGRFVDAIVRVASDSGEVSRETLQALRKLAGQTGYQVAGRYPEVNNRSEVNA